MEKMNQIKVPTHIGFIMDGNRRWAKERNQPAHVGHEYGYKTMRKVIDLVFEWGVHYISFFAFSTENWNREKQEVDFLMKLFSEKIKEETANAIEKGYRLIISGRIGQSEGLPGDLPEACRDAMFKTKDNSKGTINICLNYGGRTEIVDAMVKIAKKIAEKKLESEQISEGLIKKHLYCSDLPDPDLIVRTSGEFRSSGFLLWESAYSEYIYLQKYWPDMEKADIDNIMIEYNNRQRRFGI